MLRVKEKGLFKVVTSSSELEMWTSCGWRLIAVLDNTAVQTLTGYENVPIGPNLAYQSAQGTYNTSGYPNPPYVTESRQVTTNHTIRTQSFLLLQDEESAIATFNYKMSEYEAKLHEKDKVTKDQELKLKELGVAKVKLEEQVKWWDEKEKDAHGKFEALQKQYATFVETVAEKLTQAEAVLERDKERRRTAYERVVQGDFDDTVESFEAGDHG
jgi:hypothetical protein